VSRAWINPRNSASSQTPARIEMAANCQIDHDPKMGRTTCSRNWRMIASGDEALRNVQRNATTIGTVAAMPQSTPARSSLVIPKSGHLNNAAIAHATARSNSSVIQPNQNCRHRSVMPLRFPSSC
jgi:hypothetical protein